VIERCFNRLKGFHGIATRYEKTATSYEAAVTLASFLLWKMRIVRSLFPAKPEEFLEVKVRPGIGVCPLDPGPKE
jgi:hypothetical protein